MQINMFVGKPNNIFLQEVIENCKSLILGLILDIILVAVIKAATRRRRPTVHDDLFTIGPDKFR